MMKKTIVIAAALLLAATSAFAQKNLSIGAGFNNINNSFKAGDYTTKESLPGFYAGADVNIMFNDNFGVAPGVYYIMGMTSNSSYFKSSHQEHYFQIPVALNYGTAFGSTVRAFAYTGPVFSFGLINSAKVTSEVLDASKSTNLYGENSSISRFNLLWNAGVGIDLFESIRVTAGYDFGLLNRQKDSNVKQHTSQYHIGVAYLF